MSMFDYIGYETGIRSKMTAAQLIDRANELRNVPYYFDRQEIRDLPDDLKFVQNHPIDWGMFTPRWGRV